MNMLASIWRYLNLLSLDVVFGAMAGMLFFADVLNLSLSFVFYMVLGMVVWGIYTLDHLIDAKKITHFASSDRHRFHQKHFVPLSIILGFVILTSIGIVLYCENLNFILLPGVILGGVMLVWMGLLQFFENKFAWLKEISTAFFYVLGISLAPVFSQFPNEIPHEFFFLMLAYMLLAAINLYMLSYIDEKNDTQDKLGSALQLMSNAVLKRFILLLSSGTVIYLLTLLIGFLPTTEYTVAFY